jgi:WD40 repeat protein
MNFVRKKDKQAQMMVANLSQHMSVQNIQLNLKQKIHTKGRCITGCSLLPGGRMVISCSSTNTVSFINTGGVELFHISKENTGLGTHNTVYIKDNNSIAVSSGDGNNKCIAIIDIESQKVMTTISMDTNIYGMAVRGRTIYYCTKDKGIKMLNLSDKSVSDIINSNMSGVYFVATFDDKLYFTNTYTNTVTCL